MIYEITLGITKRINADNIHEALMSCYGASPISITCENNGDSFDVKKCEGCGKLLLEEEYKTDCEGVILCDECYAEEERDKNCYRDWPK
jgi:formylmethanofuran dehydrogenase subunit E